MATQRTALGLLFLGAVGAFPTTRAPCESSILHNKSASSCYCCPSDYVSWKSCPQKPQDCIKKCGEDHYMENERKPRCQSCVTCLEDDLVEKSSCTWNSPRVCECRPGMFCETAAANSCARCTKHSLCPPGKRVQLQGTLEKDTVCEPCPPGTFSSHKSSSKDCQPHTRCPKMIKQMGNATHDHVCSDPDPSTFLPEAVMNLHTISPTVRIPDTTDPSNTTTDPSNQSSTPGIGTISPSLTGRPNPGSESLFWLVTIFAVTFGFVLFLICQQRACRKGILQKFHLYSGQTFQPEKLSVDRNHRTNCQPGSLSKNSEISEKQGLMSSRSAPEMNCHVTSSRDLDLKATENLGPGDLPEPRATTTEHTNNQIENIYIMKADTVIVGSVARVSEGRNPATTLELEEETLAADRSTHYPEQETELSPGGHTEVMFSVEEEGKGYHWPTAVSAE